MRIIQGNGKTEIGRERRNKNAVDDDGDTTAYNEEIRR